jgi:hypothetical protein
MDAVHDATLKGISNDNWGARARIGMFIVGSEAVPEAEWQAMAPQGVSSQLPPRGRPGGRTIEVLILLMTWRAVVDSLPP